MNALSNTMHNHLKIFHSFVKSPGIDWVEFDSRNITGSITFSASSSPLTYQYGCCDGTSGGGDGEHAVVWIVQRYPSIWTFGTDQCEPASELQEITNGEVIINNELKNITYTVKWWNTGYLGTGEERMGPVSSQSITYDAGGGDLTIQLPPFTEDVALKIYPAP
jgi:hypothetical protein